MPDKKTAIVTGATGAIGKAIARQILSTNLYRVIMVTRDPGKAEKAREDIIRATGIEDLFVEITDVSRKHEIFALADRGYSLVHVLVNVAAHSPRPRQETPEGIERQWATNVLGYYWMMEAFRPHLQAGTPSRIVNVASYWAGGLDLDDPEFKHRRYNNDTAYRQSKQANRMLSASLADLYRPDGITVNACHPGDVNSRLSNDLGYGGHETPDHGADTPVWLAISPEVEGVTGKYFENRQEHNCSFCLNKKEMKQLLDLVRKY
ncbi:MAG: SDR family NAD(P)-dependent oxidoreductase [Bacteroidales bacterium]